MDITTRNIEQCDAVSILNAIIDMHDHPQKIDQIAADVTQLKSTAAKESTSQEIKTLILNEGVDKADEYAETINSIIGDWNNE